MVLQEYCSPLSASFLLLLFIITYKYSTASYFEATNQAVFFDELEEIILVLYLSQMVSFHFLEDVSPLTKEASSVLTNWVGVSLQSC